jgi:ribonuclease J
MPSQKHLEVVPLGGLGDFGMNLMVYRYGDDCVVVDAGMMFPGEEHLGVNVVIPDLSFLDACGTLHGVILSHGHEDHIGALPYLLARRDAPVYSMPYTEGLIRGRLEAHEMLKDCSLRRLPSNGAGVELGPFTVETIPVAHSIPQSRMIVLHTPVGTLLHTADFKLDPNPPDGEGSDLARLSELGKRGVLALLSDSTNAEIAGFTQGERSVAMAIDRLLASSEHRVIVACFSSNIQRVQLLATQAARHGRRVALVGTSLQNQADVAQQLGLLRFAPGQRVAAGDAMGLPRERVLIVVTGSQGEPMSALARIAVARHRDVAVEPGDRIVFSARSIPGNEKSIGRMIDHLLRRGAEVITPADAPVHVSGHPSRDELQQLIQLARPRFLIPIHGEYKHLHAHARLGREVGMGASRVRVAESGDVIVLNERRVDVGERIHVGKIFIDGSLDRVDRSLIKDRRRSAGDGIVVAVVAVDREGGAVSGFPEIVTRGFVPDSDGEGEGEVVQELKNLLIASLAEASPEERADEVLLRTRIHTELKRFLRRRTRRQPLIIPVIVEM